MSSVWAGPAVTSSTASSMSTTLPRVLTNSGARVGLRVALPSMQIPQILQQSPRGSGGVLRGGRSLMQGATKGAIKGATQGALKRVPAGRLLLPLAVGGLLWRGWPWRTGYPGAKRTLENSLSGKWSAGSTLMTTRQHTSQSARRRDPDVAANAAAAGAAAASSVEELREDYELALAAYLAITPRQWRWRMQLYIDAPLLLDKLERVPRQRLIEDIAAKLDLRGRRYSARTGILSSKKKGLYIFIVYMMSLDPPSQVEVARRLGIPSSNVQSMITAIQIILRRHADSLASPTTVASSIAPGIAPGIALGITSKTVQPYDHLEGPLSVLIEEYESMSNQRWRDLNSSLLADDPVKLEVLSNIPRKSILEAIEKDHGGSQSGADDHAQRLKGIRAQYVYLSYLMKLGPPKEQFLSALANMLEVSNTVLRELTSSIPRSLDQLSSSAHSEEVESQKFWVELEGKVAPLADLYVDMPHNQWLERMTLVFVIAQREALMNIPREDHLRAIDEYSHTLSRHTGGRGDSHYFEIRALSYQYVFLAHMMRLAPEENRSETHLTRYLAYTLNYHHRVMNYIAVALRSLARHERGRGSEEYKNARVGIAIKANRRHLVNSPEWGVVDESILARRHEQYVELRRRMLKINSEELRKRLQDLLPGKALPKSLKPRMVLNYLETQFSQGPVHLFLAYDLAIAPKSYRRIIEGYYPNADLSEDTGVTKEIIDQLDFLAQRGFHIEYLSIGEYSLLDKEYWAPWRTKAIQQKILHGHYIDPDHAESFIEGVEQLRDRYYAEAQALYGRQLQDPRARYKELVLAGYLYYGDGFTIEDAYTRKAPPLYTLYFQRAEVRDDFMALVEQSSIPPH